MDLVRKLKLVRTLRTLRIFAPRVRRIRTLSERCERCEFLGYPLKGVTPSEIRTTCAVASCSEAKTGRGPEIRTSRSEKRENCAPSASRSLLRPVTRDSAGSQLRTQYSFPLLASPWDLRQARCAWKAYSRATSWGSAFLFPPLSSKQPQRAARISRECPIKGRRTRNSTRMQQIPGPGSRLHHNSGPDEKGQS